jgi:hypothetical protein
LQHQSSYSKNCDLIHEYAEGKDAGETGWAPIMGVGYYKTLHYGLSVQVSKDAP